MENQFSRTELIIGKEKMEILKKSKVAIFGIGGVGSYVVEGLARAGIGKFVLVDDDEISVSNINRQIIATHSTIGISKVEAAKKRILEINPEAKIEMYKDFFMPETTGILEESIDYVIDAVDTVTAKIELIIRANKLNIPIISCMGTGNKLDPTGFEITDIYKTSVCPLAKVMRKELKVRGIKKLKVLYSKEEPIQINQIKNEDNADEIKGLNIGEEIKGITRKKQSPGSISFVPSVAGLIIAGEVVKDLININ